MRIGQVPRERRAGQTAAPLAPRMAAAAFARNLLQIASGEIL